MLGIELSERTCRRILDGQIGALDPVLEQVVLSVPAKGSGRKHTGRLRADARGLKLHPGDAEELSRTVKCAFADIARKYYLEGDVEVQVRARSERITITIPVVKLP